MKKLNFIVGLIALAICLPIWYYLLYQILVRVQATELMMFLFWIYVPTMALVGVARDVVKSLED